MADACNRDKCERDRAIENEGRLVRLEEKVDAINGKLDDAIIAQLKDHGKRLSALERARAYSTGWVVGASAAVGALTTLIAKKIL